MTAQSPVISAVTLGNNTSIAVSPDQQARQWQARQRKYELQDIMAELLPNDRVSWCLKHRQSGGSNIEIVYDQAQQRAYYGNLLVCGSVWTCPVCAARITEQRRVELDDAIKRWRAGGGGVIMAAFTLQHSVDDDIADLRKTLNAAYRKMTDRRTYKDSKRRCGIVGSVASLEVTHAFRHGWHPHRHVLYFTEKDLTDQDYFNLQVAFAGAWRSVLDSVGRWAHAQAGVVLSRGDDQAGDYVCKWSMAHEMTKSPVKGGRDGGLSPFEMAEQWQVTGDQRYARLIRDYSRAFYRSKQLTYTPGLKARLGILDKSDQQIVAEQQAGAVIMAELDKSSWQRVYIRRWRGIILKAASTGDQSELAAVLDKLGVAAAETADDGHVIYRSRSP